MKVIVCVIPKRKLCFKIRFESDLLPVSEEHVYRVEFYTIPYIRAVDTHGQLLLYGS